MKFASPWLARRTALVAIFLSFGFFLDRAQACRDCPFPMSRLHWRMPSGNSEVRVEEVNLGRGRVQSIVRLLESDTGDLLAIGYLDHTKGRKRLSVNLIDFAGGRMRAELSYLNVDRDQVKIKISCLRCNVKPAYLN